MAKDLFALGAKKVYLTLDDSLILYQSGQYAQALATMVKQHSPDIILFAATSTGSELASRAAARLETGLTAHCMDLYIDDEGLLVQVVPGYGGNIIVKNICPEKRPQMATARSGVSKKPEPAEDATGELVEVAVAFNDNDEKGARTLQFHPEVQEAQSIESADIVVSFGYGVKTEEDFALIKELADALGEGTAIGGTRPVVDEGMISEKVMIGQSGVIIAPKLLFAIGISGAMHFNVGVFDAGYIVAINTDPKAEIFDIADLGIVGDLREVLPALIEAIKSRK